MAITTAIPAAAIPAATKPRFQTAAGFTALLRRLRAAAAVTIAAAAIITVAVATADFYR